MTVNEYLTGVFDQVGMAGLISQIVRAVLIIIVAIPILALLNKGIKKLSKGIPSLQVGQILVKMVLYVSFLFVVLMVLHEFGFKLSALLAVAGVFGVAISFASQTSMSNIISGIFLISEKPFGVGDSVQVDDVVGSIESIDLLSIKLKTPDNRFIRVPNETMIKSEVINLTRYPIRRVNVKMIVSYNDDLERAMQLLRDIAEGASLSLKDPQPLVLLQGFEQYGISILLGVWAETKNYWDLQNELIFTIKQEFIKTGMEIPIPSITVHQSMDKEIRNITTNQNKEG